MSPIDPIKADFRKDILRDRRMWRWVIAPQLLLFLLLVILIATSSAYGLYSSVGAIKSPTFDFNSISKLIIGGGSGVGSLSVIKIFSKVIDLSKEILHQERRFTTELTLVSMATTQPDLKTVVQSYGKTTK
jgi:hypothetical protein